MKIKNKSLVLYQIVAIALLFTSFIVKINNIWLLIGLLATYIYVRKYNKYNKENNNTIIFTTILLIIYISFYYLLGLISSYETNYAYILYKYINKIDVIKIILIVVISELIRSAIINKIYIKDKKLNINIILFVIIYVLIDMNISIRVQAFNSIKQFYLLLGMVIMPSISKNILLNFLTKNKKSKSSIIYRLINDLYIFLLPITPVINLYYESIILVVFPYLYYLIYCSFFVKLTIKESMKNKSIKNRLANVIYVAILLVIIAVVSGTFKCSILSIASESMTGTIDKGDVIVLHKVNKKELEEGKIIIFEKNGSLFVHRIIEMYTDDKGSMFITKGDANETKDMWVVYEDDIKGVYDFRIKYIGYPSVWLRELF